MDGECLDILFQKILHYMLQNSIKIKQNHRYGVKNVKVKKYPKIRDRS